MAIYRFEARIIGRSDNPLGRSVVAAAAYRSGTRLRDEKYASTPDYSRRAAGVVHSEILAPDSAPSWATDRGKLWNAVEAKEDTHNRRKDAQLAREFIPALPAELSREERQALVTGFVRDELASRGMVADVSVHEPKTGKNFHAHILCTLRPIDAEGFGKKAREWNETKLLEHFRESWENAVNTALEAAGHDVRVDRRSLEAQGLDRVPEPKLGVAATAMEREGYDTERGRMVRGVRMDNRIRSAVRDIATLGEVQQSGLGGSWWERAQVAIGRGADLAREFLADESSGGRGLPQSWQDYVLDRPTERKQPEPELG